MCVRLYSWEKLEEQPCGAAYQGGACRYNGAGSYASTVGEV